MAGHFFFSAKFYKSAEIFYFLWKHKAKPQPSPLVMLTRAVERVEVIEGALVKSENFSKC